MGRSIIMTGYAALEATDAIIGYGRETLEKRYSASFINEAGLFCKNTDITEHIKAADAVPGTEVFPLGDTGVFGGLWEFAQEKGAGFTVTMDDIPIKQHTVEFCDLMDTDLYAAPSKGSMLAAAEDPQGFIYECESRGINAVLIGHFTGSSKRIFITPDGGERYAERPDNTEKIKLLKLKYARVEE